MSHNLKDIILCILPGCAVVLGGRDIPCPSYSILIGESPENTFTIALLTSICPRNWLSLDYTFLEAENSLFTTRHTKFIQLVLIKLSSYGKVCPSNSHSSNSTGKTTLSGLIQGMSVWISGFWSHVHHYRAYMILDKVYNLNRSWLWNGDKWLC